MTKHLNTLAVALLVGSACMAQAFFPPADAKKLVTEGALLLDVRTPEEFKDGHVEGAKNIPVQELEKRLAEVGDKSRAVVVYCRSGRRSETAKGILLKAGWKRVENLGGIDNWPAKSGS
jgi:phage shock protein E